MAHPVAARPQEKGKEKELDCKLTTSICCALKLASPKNFNHYATYHTVLAHRPDIDAVAIVTAHRALAGWEQQYSSQ